MKNDWVPLLLPRSSWRHVHSFDVGPTATCPGHLASFFGTEMFQGFHNFINLSLPQQMKNRTTKHRKCHDGNVYYGGLNLARVLMMPLPDGPRAKFVVLVLLVGWLCNVLQSPCDCVRILFCSWHSPSTLSS